MNDQLGAILEIWLSVTLGCFLPCLPSSLHSGDEDRLGIPCLP